MPPAETKSALPYQRTIVQLSPAHEVLLMQWRAGGLAAPHDHGASGGGVHLVKGRFTERIYGHDRLGGLVVVATHHHEAPAYLAVRAGEIHDMQSHDAGISVHVYHPTIQRMRVYDLVRRQTLVVTDDCGAWVPDDPRQIVTREPWP